MKTRKASFRLTEAKNRKRNRRSSPHSAVMIALLALLGSPYALGQTESEAQAIERAVRQSLDQELAQMAQFRKWPAYQSQFDIWVPGAAKHLAACEVELEVTGRDNQSMPVGHLKRLVSCDQQTAPWKMNVTIKAALTLPVVVAKNLIRRGETVNITNLQLVSKTLKNETSVFTRLDQAAGKEALRQVRSGQILSPVYIVSPALVEKGNQVVIIAEQDGFQASTKGIALQNGGEGEQIEVQNSSSQKVIRATVTGVNEVHTQF